MGHSCHSYLQFRVRPSRWSMDWFKGKSKPETIDFPIKIMGFSGEKFPKKTIPLTQETGDYQRLFCGCWLKPKHHVKVRLNLGWAFPKLGIWTLQSEKKISPEMIFICAMRESSQKLDCHGLYCGMVIHFHGIWWVFIYQLSGFPIWVGRP